MAKQLTNLSGLRGDRLDIDGDGKVSRAEFKAHLAELQQVLRDVQEEVRVLTGGGKSQVPASKKQPFKLETSAAATSKKNVAAERSLRTTTKSRVSDDLVTRRELQDSTAQASTATGFMDLLTDQIVASGNKDFGSISFQRSHYTLVDSTTYTVVDLSGATFWEIEPLSFTGSVTINGFTAPSPSKGMLRVVVWSPQVTTQNLILTHLALAPTATTARIDTLSGTTPGASTISTSGAGAFVLLYNLRLSRWQVIARTA